MLDRHGNFLEKHQQVVVLEPKGTDRHKRSFIGTIIAVLDSRGTAMVEDQCDESFEIEGDRLVIQD